MQVSPRVAVSSLLLLGTVAGVLLLGSNQSALSYPLENALPVRWEYLTAATEVGSLQTRLNEFAEQGWEVFSVERMGSVLDQGADGKTRLQVENFQVTGKRPRKQ